MDLYIVRHAIAASRDIAEWPNDGLRPLTENGVERFRRAARGLKRLAPSVDVVLSSPYARAWHTAELLQEEARWPAPIASEELQAERSPIEALKALDPYSETASVAVVGHEPGLSELASVLLGASADVPLELKKGGAMFLLIRGHPGRGSASLRWLLTPKVLRSLAK